MGVENVLENWDRNRADATDVLVALVRGLIPDVKDKNSATEAIYKHVGELIRHERESCASMCSTISDAFAEASDLGQAMGAGQCADQIRARTMSPTTA